MNIIHLRLAALLVLTGCANLPYPDATRAPPDASSDAEHYEAEAGRDAAFVARMRAAPPPEEPDVRDGGSPAGDLRLLNGQGFVRIGTGRFRADDPAARERAETLGREVGADKVLLYRTPATESPERSAGNAINATSATDTELRAVYFVRLRLPFGATFRDLESAERARLGDRGGVRIGSVIGNSPASEANLRAGDFVLALDGEPIRGKADFRERLEARAGQRVNLTVNRNGADMQRMVRLGTIASDQP
jgi:hypothetical protein